MFSFLSRSNSKHITNSRNVSQRTVKSIRWIPSSELQIGMYVSELDRPWEDTHFMFQGFTVSNMPLLKEVQKSCERVLVETTKVAVVAKRSPSRMCGGARS